MWFKFDFPKVVATNYLKKKLYVRSEIKGYW